MGRGNPLVLFLKDEYFFGEDVFDWLVDHPEDVRICKCKPEYLRLIDSEYWADDLPEDGEIPQQVEDAMVALNKAISEAGPSGWREDDIAIDVADLRSRMTKGGSESRITVERNA